VGDIRRVEGRKNEGAIVLQASFVSRHLRTSSVIKMSQKSAGS
jgi:hypothetical protein